MKDPLAISRALLARPGDWPPAAPNAITALACFHSMLEIISDGSAEAAEHCEAFAAAGGIRAVVQQLEETALEVGRKAKQIDPANLEMNCVLQSLLMLADVQTVGCTLLSNLAAASAGGRSRVVQDELRISQTTGAVVRSLMLYPENPEHVEAGLAALLQLLPLDTKAFLAVGAPSVVIAAMVSPAARPWLLYLGARVLAATAQLGPEAREALVHKEGAVPALVRAVRAPPDPTAGAEWGVSNVWAKLQLVARTAMATLLGLEGFRCGSGRAIVGTLECSHFVLHDPVVLVELEGERRELNGCVALVVGAGEHGVGPQPATSQYGMRVEHPPDKRGQIIELPAANLRLMAPPDSY